MKKLLTPVFALACLLAPVGGALADGQHAATVWVVVFNKPWLCGGSDAPVPGARCSEADIGNPAVEPAIIYATGGLTDMWGNFVAVASIYESKVMLDLPNEVDPADLNRGMRRSQAEFHIVIRDHGHVVGPALPEPPLAAVWIPLKEQITAFLEPGCQDLGGDNVCEDVQFAIVPPGNGDLAPQFIWADLFDFTPDDFGNLVKKGHVSFARRKDMVQAIVVTDVDD